MKYNSYQPKSQFMKLVEGENKIRLVSEAEEFISEYNGKQSTRFVANVIDRADGAIKPFTFGSQIMGQLAALANGSEYGFDSLPPYDIIIHKTGSGMATEYKVTPSRKDVALTNEEEKAIAELKPVSEMAQKLSKKSDQQVPIEAYDDVSQIPF